MSAFEHYLSIWVALAIVAGLALGQIAPGLVVYLAGLDYGSGAPSLAKRRQIASPMPCEPSFITTTFSTNHTFAHSFQMHRKPDRSSKPQCPEFGARIIKQHIPNELQIHKGH